MSSQKDKFLASAQKYIQKGQFDRALRDYEQVVTADPKDVKLRQKLAELMVRCNRREDAIREYNTIAKYYDENGFYLKAIAVYKQIQRLDSSNLEISLALAALNEKQGMIGNALSEYKILYDHYQKEGMIDNAVEILEKMHAVDPENIDIRIKLAETLFAAGSTEKSYQEYTRAALSLKSQGNIDTFDRVCRKIHELFPDRSESSVIDILSEQIKNGVLDDALPKLEKMVSEDPENPAALDLLAEAYRLAGDGEKRKETLKRILDILPAELAPKKNLILCFVEDGDLEGSIALLDRYAADLFSAGAYGDLEHYYTTLQNLAPYDTRLLEGLKKLYEMTGESTKLADVQVSLNILSQKQEEEGNAVEPTETAASSAPVMDSAAAEVAWSDEIDLSLTVDEEPEPLDDTVSAGSLDFGSIEISTEDVTAGESADQEFEIDISFEVPDDSPVFAPPAMESDAAAPDEDVLPSAFSMSDDTSPFDFGVVEDSPVELPLDGAVDADPFAQGEDAGEFLPAQDPEPFSFEEEQPSDFGVPSAVEEFSLTEEVPEEPAEAFFEQPDSTATAEENTPVDFASDATVFDRFKDTVEGEHDQGDAETHYNLGIAYMEMGLFDEAVKEFRISANAPDREMDSLTLQGVCFRDRGDYSDAEEVFAALINLSQLDADRVLALRYELGLLFEAAGRKDEALVEFRRVFASNPAFRDTMQKIADLSRPASSFDLSGLDDVEIELEELE